MVDDACRTHFRIELSKALGSRIPPDSKLSDQVMRDLIFGNYMEPDAEPKIYDEVEDWRKLENIMNYYLSEYNANSSAPMDLVLFRFAIEHISRYRLREQVIIFKKHTCFICLLQSFAYISNATGKCSYGRPRWLG